MFGVKIYAVSDSVAWTLGLGNVVGGVGYTQSCISKIVDKGNSWYNIIYPQPGLTYATSTWSLDQDTVWTTITYYPNGSGGPVENQLFNSVDGGLHWTEIPNPVTVYINFVYFWNSEEYLITDFPTPAPSVPSPYPKIGASQ